MLDTDFREKVKNNFSEIELLPKLLILQNKMRIIFIFTFNP